MPFANFAPYSFSPASVRNNAPAASGVYGLSNSREWVFVGESEDIRAALLAHLLESHTRLKNSAPTGFTFELCATSGRAARQDRLVLELEPVCNRRGNARVANPEQYHR
jgi:hypothetical protein